MPEDYLPRHMLTEAHHHIRHRASPPVIESLIILERNIPSAESKIIRTRRKPALLKAWHIIAWSLRTDKFFLKDFRPGCPIRIYCELIDRSIERTIYRHSCLLQKRRGPYRCTTYPKVIILLIDSRQLCVQTGNLLSIYCKIQSFAAAEHRGNP